MNINFSEIFEGIDIKINEKNITTCPLVVPLPRPNKKNEIDKYSIASNISMFNTYKCYFDLILNITNTQIAIKCNKCKYEGNVNENMFGIESFLNSTALQRLHSNLNNTNLDNWENKKSANKIKQYKKDYKMIEIQNFSSFITHHNSSYPEYKSNDNFFEFDVVDESKPITFDVYVFSTELLTRFIEYFRNHDFFYSHEIIGRFKQVGAEFDVFILCHYYLDEAVPFFKK